MKIHIALISSAFVLTACVTTDSTPNWVEYFNNDTAIMSVDQNTKKASDYGVNAKASTILIDYVSADAVGTHSAKIPIIIDCEKKTIKIGGYAAYGEPGAQGGIIRQDPTSNNEFNPLGDYANGDKMHEILCNK